MMFPKILWYHYQIKHLFQAIFKETQRPSREMQQTIAEHLRLDLSTVANFFMNARRRSRSGPLVGDAPAPYQQVVLFECSDVFRHLMVIITFPCS